TPNLSRKGAVKLPALVVAPINVKGGKSIRILRASSPLPITISRKKSSIAGYKTSSTTLLNLCISSINNTSPGCKLDKIAAKSPGRSIDGPEMVLILTSISLAMILDKVVLPNPGGPNKKTLTKGSLLILASFLKNSKFDFIVCCSLLWLNFFCLKNNSNDD